MDDGGNNDNNDSGAKDKNRESTDSLTDQINKNSENVFK